MWGKDLRLSSCLGKDPSGESFTTDFFALSTKKRSEQGCTGTSAPESAAQNFDRTKVARARALFAAKGCLPSSRST